MQCGEILGTGQSGWIGQTLAKLLLLLQLFLLLSLLFPQHFGTLNLLDGIGNGGRIGGFVGAMRRIVVDCRSVIAAVGISAVSMWLRWYSNLLAFLEPIINGNIVFVVF